MLILNFSHPLTKLQLERIKELTDQSEIIVQQIPCHFDPESSFVKQTTQMLKDLPLRNDDWQSETILIVPPSLNTITTVLLADLHGRMGYFPAIVRLRPVENSTPRQFEVAEIINLQEVRDQARQTRSS